MSVLRLARGVTGRNKIIKFAGCYHGHVDALLAAAGSGVATLSIAWHPRVTEATTADTIVLAYNDRAAVRAAFAAFGDQIAAVITEAAAGNMGVDPARDRGRRRLQRLPGRHRHANMAPCSSPTR